MTPEIIPTKSPTWSAKQAERALGRQIKRGHAVAVVVAVERWHLRLQFAEGGEVLIRRDAAPGADVGSYLALGPAVPRRSPA